MSTLSFDFTGSNIIVAGASSGMGRRVVDELLQARATVFGIDLRQDLLNEISAANPNFVGLACDVRDIATIKAGLDNFVAARGKFHGLFYATGISAPSTIKDFDNQKAHDMMDINFFAAIELIKAVNRKKIAESGFSNVLISSISAYSGEKSLLGYSASKAALQVSVKAIAKEIKTTGSRINSVSPGYVRTVAMQKIFLSPEILEKQMLGLGDVEDVSGMVLFLLSDRAKWITGADFVVDGGFLAS